MILNIQFFFIHPEKGERNFITLTLFALLAEFPILILLLLLFSPLLLLLESLDWWDVSEWRRPEIYGLIFKKKSNLKKFLFKNKIDFLDKTLEI